MQGLFRELCSDMLFPSLPLARLSSCGRFFPLDIRGTCFHLGSTDTYAVLDLVAPKAGSRLSTFRCAEFLNTCANTLLSTSKNHDSSDIVEDDQVYLGENDANLGQVPTKFKVISLVLARLVR